MGRVSEIMEEFDEFDEGDVKVEEDEVRVEIMDEVKDDSERMCDQCPAVCSSSKSLKRHRQLMHDTRQCICQECGVSVVFMKALNDQKRTNRTFTCPHCDKKIGIQQKSCLT